MNNDMFNLKNLFSADELKRLREESDRQIEETCKRQAEAKGKKEILLPESLMYESIQKGNPCGY